MKTRKISYECWDEEEAFLKLLGSRLLPLSTNHTLAGILEIWSDLEGWYPLDGTHGVRLTQIDCWEFDDVVVS